MAGFFGMFNYSKAGQGVSKNTSQKKPFFLFWELYFRKFGKLCRVSALFMLLFIPLMVLTFIISKVFINNDILLLTFSIMPYILCGPLIAGLFKVTRDLSQDRSVFIFSDFKKAVFSNYKQSLIMSFISYILITVSFIAIIFYLAKSSQSILYLFPFAISLLFTTIIIFSQYYAYLLMVTVKLSFKDVLKNCFIFSILSLWRNFLITIIIAIIVGITAFMFLIGLYNPIFLFFGVALLFLIVPGHIGFISNFISYPQIKKYVIDPYYKNHPELTAEGFKQTILKDEPDSDLIKNEKKTDYVYENGKMVHKSLLEKENIFEDKGKNK